ncbi:MULTISPECIES: hypothetical protein [Sphingomonas]|jgi:hypothetical protein|uniref:DUF1640 domain-containing protein n=1 Tax=Sphingomonas abaci TaxID=237611 RepID=A0A7W7AN21_9SPHN|nr:MULTISPECIES: hypothetical protein [Sphingomonas]ATI56826.1 hypothetical protein CP552_14415 [Sphingomonas melonis]MBB4619170.1 hypothetical protein [Sphingomonas abaci]MBX8846465.1 hypothetical protein [Sphingomonas melonis]MBX8855585.1 hypothetical protein [Sphingomonas melonis]MBX8900594.1 hypothetical protein [Sphingomonas melonis]
MATMFNSIRASRDLETAGAAKPLADAIATILGDTMVTSREDLVTKDYLKAEIATVHTEMAKVRTEIASAKNDTIRWLIGSQVVLIAALGGMMSLMRAFG